jgi:DNA-binding transcriptional regulator LsrR (DeoR family)
MKRKPPGNKANFPARATKPIEFPDAITWAAWLYFVDEMTQSEVAEAIGVSRVTVMKMLNDAKRAGIVSIKIRPKIASRVSVSRELAAYYGLNSVMIVPENPTIPLTERLGKAGAFALMDNLVPHDVVGIAWGKTVLSVAQNVRLDSPVENITVVSVSASPNGLSADFSPELCAALFANNLEARSVNLLAPAIVSSAELRAMLLNEPSIRAQLDVIRSANKVVFGVGDLNSGATVRGSELYSAKTIDELVENGAAAVILGTFLDGEGGEMASPTHDCTIGIGLDEFAAIPQRLCVAGGTAKIEAIRATLMGGYATDLITDFQTASMLLEKAKAEN